MPYLVFLSEITGIGSFSFISMLTVQLFSIAVLGTFMWLRIRTHHTPSPTPTPNPIPLWQTFLLATLGIWFALKLAAGFLLLIGPSYYDDTLKNWNMRGKIFFVEERLVLETIPEKGVGVGSYPQSVPLIKTWLAHVNGSWHDGLINSVHILWYLAAIALLYFAIRRIRDARWALIGAYILGSVPLYAIHGFSAYADQFLSLMIFLAVVWLFLAARSKGETRASYLRIGALAAGLLVYTKNEAMLLHLPPILLLLICVLFLQSSSKKEIRTALLWYAVAIGSVLLPWLLFKWSHSLAFGNAKEISGLSLTWQSGVLYVIFINTFLEGNWSILPAVFLGLLAFRWKNVATSSLLLPVGFVAIVIIGQLPIYLFTELSTEALNQTGYARGIIHLVPLIVLITTILLQDAFSTMHQVRERNNQ